MHAARAIKANREKRVDKLNVETRRPSATSQISRIVTRSPAVSIDTTKKVHLAHDDDSDNLNFSYVGFLIAVFGAVPLVVGTFVEVPALWEIGLGVTLVGLFIGVVFWCTELCAEAKKFSQKKSQLSTRGKIEDSNLLQVPDRKFHHGNGLESRRSSFQSDSVSLITPIAQSFGSPKQLMNIPHNLTELGSKSMSQYSSSDFFKSDDSTGTLSSNTRANGHLVSNPPPKLLLRGTRKDDNRVVSLVQPDPGLEDDSDSDAETVIEAPTGKPKIIQVQTLQERGRQRCSPYSRESGVVLGVGGGHPMDPETTFHLENETVPPLVPFAQHRTIRMPVMPQEVDKLQRCECGRYLLTERDKLVGVRLSGIAGGGSSMPATTYNSPSLTGSAAAGAGTAPAQRKVFSRGTAGSLGLTSTPDSSNSSSINDIYSAITASSTDNKIISVNPSSEGRQSARRVSSATSRKSSDKNSVIKSAQAPLPTKSEPALTSGESVVQVEPLVISSDLLVSGKKTDAALRADEEEIAGEEVIAPASPSGKALRQTKRPTRMDEEDNDRILEELLELTDVDEGTLKSKSKQKIVKRLSSGDKPEDMQKEVFHAEEDDDDDDEFFIPSPSPVLRSEGQEGDEKPRISSANRPTSLALPMTISDSSGIASMNNTDSELGSGMIISSASSASSASTVVFIGESAHSSNGKEGESTSRPDLSSTEAESKPPLSTEMSLDELLDKIEQKQDDDTPAVVVQ